MTSWLLTGEGICGILFTVATKMVTVENGVGRVERLVRWLEANAERISRPEKVQVTFDCAGSTVHATVKVSESVDPAQLR